MRVRFFVLGAGASKSSGIMTGQELVDIWEKELIERNQEDYLSWKEQLGITEENKYNFYSRYYEKRFQQCPMDGLNFLEKMIEHVNPGVGYVMLAEILTNTRHNVVITTNFDHLIEDALNYYSHAIPLIIGHESLAHYVSKQITRPMILKIHRDLLFDPKNTAQEVEELHEAWKNSLDLVFSEYHPVFIGYAGNDNSLMNYLIENKDKFEKDEWKFPYWTLYQSGDLPGKVREFLEKAGGYCINCDGFDELLCFIGEEFGYKIPREDVFLNDAKKRYEKLSESFENILRNKGKEVEISGTAEVKTLGQVAQTLADSDNTLAKSIRAISLHNQRRYQEALELERELVSEEPESARYHGNLGATLHILGRYEEARREAEKAVELEPGDARYHGNLGITLHALGRYEEARREAEKAVELEPGSARYHDNLGATLHALGRYEEARREAGKAVELEPGNARYHGNLGATLHALGRYEEARRETEKAVELEPDDTRYRESLEKTMRTIREGNE